MAAATPPTPPNILQTLANGVDIKFNVTGQLPGESLAIAILAYAQQVRATMDPALRTRLDAITVQQMEDTQAIWRGLWKALGVIQ